MSEAPLLEVENLGVNFRSEGRIVEAVKGATFTLRRGETLSLVGESGSGKSTAAMSIMQLLPYPIASHPTGSIRLDSIELVGADDRTMRKVRGSKIALVPQEPLTSLNPLHTIDRQIIESIRLHQPDISKEGALARTIELLKLVGLRDAENRIKSYPHELSGGQRQRVMIAMALANEPDLLIADEPTTALDVTVQAQVLDLLQKLQKQLGMAMLLITHDLGIVRKMAERVCVMTDGVIVEAGNTAEVFDNPQHAYTRKLLDAEPRGRPLTAEKDEAVVAADDLKVHFPIKGWFGKPRSFVKAVDGVSLRIPRGKTLGVVGESGSGKSTMGLALLRLIKSQGGIQFCGEPIDVRNTKEMRKYRDRMQIVFQDPFASLSPRLTIAQIIEEGLINFRPELSRQERRNQVRQMLDEVGLRGNILDRYPHEFSGGQRQRIAIARAIILKPEFVVLDEPTSALDMSVQGQIVDLLRDLQEKHGLTYLFISHDLKVVRALAHDIVVMKDGHVVEHGPADQIFDKPFSNYTKELISAAFDLRVKDTAKEMANTNLQKP